MSNISNRHNVVPFVAGKTAPFTGQRLAKIGYKTTAKTPAQFPSVAVSVPPLQDTEITACAERLIPYVRTFLEDTQDKIIRSLYESADGALTSVSDAEISVEQCIAFLSTEAAGNRLTTAAVESWFDDSLKDNLTIAVADKLGITDFDDTRMVAVTQKVNAFRGVISSLAGGKTLLQPAQIKACKQALSLSAEDTDIGSKLLKRLESMETPKPVAELLELD